jgi:kynurenine formamidase
MIDLTLNLNEGNNSLNVVTHGVNLKSQNTEYTGVIHDFSFNSMTGTYIDFPGHIKETDNGDDAENYPLEKLYRRKATVIRFDKESESGGVSKEEFIATVPNGVDTPILVINALGSKRFDAITERSVFLTMEAVEWICSLGIEIIISDIYESTALEGVFLKLFENNISTVCFPVNLHKLALYDYEITILPLKIPKAVQIPCRVMAVQK